MDRLSGFVVEVAGYFRSELGTSLVEAYKLGSLAHGGFSEIYSDVDVGLLLGCGEAPASMSDMIAHARALDATYGGKLSVFWGNPECSWGRLPNLDRLDMLDHGVPLFYGHRPRFRRPDRDEIRSELLRSVERTWKPRISELSGLTALSPENRKPYIRAILYAARLIFSWGHSAMDSNDRAVAYLHEIEPPGLDLRPVDMALACRQGECTAEEVFALGADLGGLCDSALAHASRTG